MSLGTGLGLGIGDEQGSEESGPPIPDCVLLMEDNSLMITEDGDYLCQEDGP